MLIDALRARLGDPAAPSFRLMGEDLALLTVEDVRVAAERQIAAIDPAIRDELLAEETALAAEAHRWLVKYNRSLYGRIAGYLALGERIEFRYPWPVVAILGIVQVLGGMNRARVYGLVGRAASRVARVTTRVGAFASQTTARVGAFASHGGAFGAFAHDAVGRLDTMATGAAERLGGFERLGDGSEDVLRRTNRGIFADSVPLVLRALRAEALMRAGNPELARGLLDGAAAVLWDRDSMALCTAIAEGLILDDRAEQFGWLALTTISHFGREQQIFTHHIASTSRRKLPAATSVPAPVVEAGRLVWKPFALPQGFDFRDHEARVEAFAQAFVMSVTGSPEDYAVATAYVKNRFGNK
ncbi:MAG: hypothetical protein ACKV2T_18560 [Kofleriaceae bacterium]